MIAQSIGQAFSVAYQEFLRVSGINPQSLSQYSDLLSSPDMYNEDLVHFSKSENSRAVSRPDVTAGHLRNLKESKITFRSDSVGQGGSDCLRPIQTS